MSYFVSRGLEIETTSFLESSFAKTCKLIPFTVQGEDYAIHHFLDNSSVIGYDAEKTNCQLNTEDTSFVVIALVEGDDAISIDVKSGKVFLWLIQSGQGEMLLVANSFMGFLRISTE